MKWPFVSRHAYEVAEKYGAFLESSLAAANAALEAQRAKNEALNERLLSLKMTGAVEPPKPDPREWDGLVPPAPRAAEADELKELIGVKCGTNLRQRALMLKQLAADRAAGVSDEVIRKQIEHGVQSDGIPS